MKLRGTLVLALALLGAPASAQVNPGTSPLSIPKGGTGAATASGARTNLGLGSMATQNANAVAITGGAGAFTTGLSLTGVSPVAVIQSTTDGVGNAGAFQVTNSTGAASVAMIANEPSRTTTRWGLTIGNWTELADFGSASSNGLVIGETNNKPLLLGTNNAERARFAGSGCLSIGNTTDCGAPGIINLLTGLRIGNAAALGHVLRGNGTNYVDGQVGVADITSFGTGVATALGVNTGTAGAFVVNGGALGSPSSAGTIPAFTLGGTLSGGGNQINNVVIGTTTPLSGAFTTLTASTSVTSPLHIGGSAAGSTLSLESTSGTGTGDSIAFLTGSQVFRGGISTGGLWSIGPNVTPNAGELLTINANTVVPPAASFGGTVFQIAGPDGAAVRTLLDSFGSNSSMSFRRSNGTAASPTQVTSGQTIGGFFFEGRDNTGFNTTDAPGIFGVAAETFTATAHGTSFTISPIPKTTLVSALSTTFNASGGVWIGTTNTDEGQNNLGIQGQIFMPSITTSSAAQNGTVCWTTGTGKFTVDTTVGCLTSIMGAKNITERLSPDKALDIISRLDPFAFRYKPGYGDGGHYEQFGFGAEEVAAVDERLAGRDPHGTLSGVRYQEMTAVLAGAIQKLKADNDDLRSKVERIRLSR